MRSLSWYEDVEKHSKYVVDSATSASVPCEAWNLRLPEALARTSCWRKVGILRILKVEVLPQSVGLGEVTTQRGSRHRSDSLLRRAPRRRDLGSAPLRRARDLANLARARPGRYDPAKRVSPNLGALE